MKIKILTKEKIILYLNNYFFKNLEKDNLTKEIKKLFIKLIKYYQLDFNGIYEVLMFENIKYGTILEITKLGDLLFTNNLIDLKVKIIKNSNFYLKSSDYFIFKDYKKVYYYDNNYYLNIKEIDNILKLIEFCEIIYNKKDNFLQNMLLIK